MRIVLDASVGLKWVLPEQDSQKALALRADYQNHVHELISPDAFPLECAHTLTKKQRQGQISTAEPLWLDVMTACPQLFLSLPLMQMAIRIASWARIAVYDCLYVALADREGCQFVTADQRLIQSLQAAYPCIVDLATL